MPDGNRRTPLTVHLSMRGTVHAPLPTYYVAAGQALHAIEDSFTHTYRTADQMKITVVLNWLAEVNATRVESRDGPAHAKALDRCDDLDELRTTRHRLAIEAAVAFLHATLGPQKTKDEKMAAVDKVLDTYVSYVPGCTFDNAWCNAPENQYKDPKGCGCRLGPTGGGLATLLGCGSLLILAIIRRARRHRRLARGLAALGVMGLLPLSAAEAHADPPTTTTTTEKPGQPATPSAPATPTTTTTVTTIPSENPDAGPTTVKVEKTPSTTTTTIKAPTDEAEHAPAPTVVPVTQPGPVDASQSAVGAYVGFSGSFSKPALAGTAGARLRVSKSWTFRLDGEWNPWIAFNGTTVREGVINVYGTAMLRFPLAYENFNLRVSASAGTSYLLTDLYGAPSGRLGLYFGASPLSVEWKLSRIFYLIINPINFAVPIPQLSDVPLLYPQYRTSVGLEVYGG